MTNLGHRHVRGSRFLGLVAAALAVLAAVSAAQVPLRDYWGEEVRAQDARMAAMGGAAGLEAGPSALFTNPALLGFCSRPAVEGTWTLKLASEQRSRTVYDQFENAIGDVAIADNLHGSGLPGPVAGAYVRGRLAAAAGLAPVRDFSYAYLKEYRDDFYIKIGEDRVLQTGTLYAGNLGLAYTPLTWLSVGAAGDYTFGSRRLESWSVTGTDTIHSLEQGKPAGPGFSAGLGFRPGHRVVVGLGFESGHKLANWQSGDSAAAARSRTYPWQARATVSYRAPGTLPSVVGVEARYQAWKSVDTTLASVLVVRAGVEHTMLNFVRLRYGFGVEPLPFDPTIQTADIGFGVGFDVGVAKVDLAATMARDIIGPDNFYGQLAQADVKVHESRTYVTLSVSRGF